LSRAEVLHWTPTDYLSDYKTRRLDLQEHGAYMLLLWHMWKDSDCQCEFPMNYAAMASIWGVCPEEAERICDSLTAPGVALVRVIERASGAVLQSKRLREQRKAFLEMCEHKSQAGKASGNARRRVRADLHESDEQNPTGVEQVSVSVEQVLNRNELTVVPYLVSPDVSKPEDQEPVSSRVSDSQPYKRGSYPQAPKITTSQAAYFAGKLGHELTADEKSSIGRFLAMPGVDQPAVASALEDAIANGAKSVMGYVRTVLENRNGAES